MARNTAFKVMFNGCLLPEIFYNYDNAKAFLRSLEESNCASWGRVVFYDDETGQVL